MSDITLTASSASVSLNMPTTFIHTVTKNVDNIVFNDGTDKQVDMGYTTFTLTINGMEYSNADDKMQTINNIMDNQEEILVSGFDDTSLNTYYLINDFSFTRESGMVDRYNYSLTIERINDGV